MQGFAAHANMFLRRPAFAGTDFCRNFADAIPTGGKGLRRMLQ